MVILLKYVLLHFERLKFAIKIHLLDSDLEPNKINLFTFLGLLMCPHSQNLDGAGGVQPVDQSHYNVKGRRNFHLLYLVDDQ